MRVVRLVAEVLGDQVHVMVRIGTEAQANRGRMPLAGSFQVSAEEWAILKTRLDLGDALLAHRPGRVDLMERQAS